MKDKIVIDVKGSSGTGKSTIVKIINDALKAHNLKVDVNMLDWETPDNIKYNGENLESRINYIRERTHLELNEKQVWRTSLK
jgi:nucleoside-triphosphatase THEP1